MAVVCDPDLMASDPHVLSLSLFFSYSSQPTHHSLLTFLPLFPLSILSLLSQVVCPVCKHDYCFKCAQNYHGTSDCPKVDKDDESNPDHGFYQACERNARKCALTELRHTYPYAHKGFQTRLIIHISLSLSPFDTHTHTLTSHIVVHQEQGEQDEAVPPLPDANREERRVQSYDLPIVPWTGLLFLSLSFSPTPLTSSLLISYSLSNIPLTSLIPSTVVLALPREGLLIQCHS